MHSGLKLIPLDVILERPTADPTHELQAQDVEYIGSYNWIEGTAPRIIVPGESTLSAWRDLLRMSPDTFQGSPPIWVEGRMPLTIPPDGGAPIIDQDGTHVPTSPLLPVFLAADVVASLKQKSVDWSSVDVIANRNSLRKLLTWATSSSRRQPYDFRIDLELVGEHTILLNRWVRSLEVFVDGKSYGLNFEKKSTKPAEGCEQSVRHLRIVKYVGPHKVVPLLSTADIPINLQKLGALTMVVRAEVDACIESAHDQLQQEKGIITNIPGSTNTTTQHGVEVIIGGHFVSQDNLVELKTCAQRKLYFHRWEYTYPQLFLSVTPHVYLAIHNCGHFNNVIKEKLDSPNLQNAKEVFQPQLWVLVAVLQMIQKLAVTHGREARLSLVCKQGRLSVYERVSKESCLPKDILARFES